MQNKLLFKYMGKKLELPKFPKPIRAAAIIETAHGVLLVQDIKDRFKAETMKELAEDMNKYLERGNHEDVDRKVAAMHIVSKGRFSLPGGGIDPIDYTNAGAEELLHLNRQPSTREELEMFRDVVREAAIREVTEEIGVKVCFEQVPAVIEIQGRQRHHIICILRAEGEIDLEPQPDKPREVSGIGFLNEDNVIPLNRFFFQAHVQKLMGKYIKKTERRQVMIPRYLSNLRVPVRYIDHWYDNLLYGYQNRPRKYRKNCLPPERPASSPTFVIFDTGNGLHNPFVPPSFTDTARARIVPPQPDSVNSITDGGYSGAGVDIATVELEETVAQSAAAPVPRAVNEISEEMILAIINSTAVYAGDDLDEEHRQIEGKSGSLPVITAEKAVDKIK